MGITAADYKNQLTALLPQGPAWQFADGKTADQQLDAWSQEFARVQSRINALVNEADPRVAYELLADWEREFGLPTDCMMGITQSLQQRRNALVSQMVSIGGQSRAYFIAIALAAGFSITITEFTPYNVGMAVNVPINGPDWGFAWQVNAPAVTVSSFLVTGGVDEALSSWGNNLLQCLINRLKPAHSVVIFSYT